MLKSYDLWCENLFKPISRVQSLSLASRQSTIISLRQRAQSRSVSFFKKIQSARTFLKPKGTRSKGNQTFLGGGGCFKWGVINPLNLRAIFILTFMI